ncbi:MAG: hypothetical protein HKM93_23880 [Desulfobacteraceae bacterium]|nr:hypothetical protein [Desulfobacteraceae bacterium]
MNVLSNRFAFVFYMVAFVLVFVAGTRMVNFALDFRLYKDFMVPWETAYDKSRRVPATWPVFQGDNHVAHMEDLVRIMKQNGISAPASNTDRAFIFEMRKFWQRNRKIFILCHNNHLILYGLSVSTTMRIDRFVDERADIRNGRFTAEPSKDTQTYIGNWRL